MRNLKIAETDLRRFLKDQGWSSKISVSLIETVPETKKSWGGWIFVAAMEGRQRKFFVPAELGRDIHVEY